MNRFARRLPLVLLAGVLILGACGGSSKKAASTSSSKSSSSTKSSSTKSSTSKSSASSATDDATDTPTIAPIVALSVDGLTFVTDPSTKNLDFGTAEAATKTALEAALGKPKNTDIGRPCDDGSSRSFDSVRYDGLVVFFLEGKLSGWSAEGQEFTTIDGIGPGSTLSDLKASFGDVTVSDGSLGTEFSAGTIGGVLDGSSDAAAVTTIFNGDLCIIR